MPQKNYGSERRSNNTTTITTAIGSADFEESGAPIAAPAVANGDAEQFRVPLQSSASNGNNSSFNVKVVNSPVQPRPSPSGSTSEIPTVAAEISSVDEYPVEVLLHEWHAQT